MFLKYISISFLIFFCTNVVVANFYKVQSKLGEGYTGCELTSDKTLIDAYNSLKKDWTECKELKETKVLGTFITKCEKPKINYPMPSEIFFVSSSKQSCEAFLSFSETNKVPPGFEKK
jgi:hypothetical protein